MVDIDSCEGSCEIFDIMAIILKSVINICVANLKNKTKKLWIIRMIIGLVFSTIDFIVICVVNNGDFLKDYNTEILFGTIICYIVCAYVICICWACKNIHIRKCISFLI